MSDRKKVIIFLSIVCTIILIIVQMKIPCIIYQLPVFYSILNEVDDFSSEFNSKASDHDINKIDPIICEKAYADIFDKEAALTFMVNCENSKEVFGLLVKDISLYLEQNPNAFLTKCRVDINYFDMGRSGIIARNYSEGNEINEPSYHYNYCYFNAFDSKLSSLKTYDWVEILEIGDEVKTDDIRPLIDMPVLRKIICPYDLFDNDQKTSLINAHKGLRFEYKQEDP